MNTKKKIIFVLTAGLLMITGLAIAGSWSGWFVRATEERSDLPDPKEEFSRLYQRYTKDTVMALGGTITLYDGENKGTVKEKTTFRFVKQHDQFYSQFSYLESVCNGTMLVQLDTVNQVIMVSDNLAEMTGNGGPAQPSFDALFSEKADFKITGKVTQDKTSNDRTMSFKSDFNPEIKSYSVTYDPATYRIKHAVIQWWKDAMVTDTTAGNRVWISHIDYQPLPVNDFNANELINKIITIKNDQVEPALKYQGYQVHITNPQQ